MSQEMMPTDCNGRQRIRRNIFQGIVWVMSGVNEWIRSGDIDLPGVDDSAEREQEEEQQSGAQRAAGRH